MTSKRIKTLLIASLILLIFSLFGCQISEPLPTPTPTRTPIIPTSTPTNTPTPTPTLTPTPTPTPTPTLPPGLILPPTPIRPEEWPALPTDLYFIRDGRLWVWLAEGGQLQAIPIVKDTEDDALLDYRVTPDKLFVIYVTTSGRLYVFDRARWQHSLIPTSGRLINDDITHLEVTTNSRYLIYTAWGVRPAEGARQHGWASPVSMDSFATILAIELEDPYRVQLQLGTCESDAARVCTKPLLSPLNKQLVFSDKDGIWLSTLPEAETQLLIPYPERTSASWFPLSWSPDEQWVLIDVVESMQTNALALLNINTGEMHALPNTECLPDCWIEAKWGPQGLWMSKNASEEGCLYKIVPDTDTIASTIIYQTCHISTWALTPTHIQSLPDGWVAFIHNGCGTNCPGPAPGLYFLGPEELVRPVALLPQTEGPVLWAPEGMAFLCFDKDSQPTYMGVSSGTGFWDIRDKLEGAHTFRWNQPELRQP